MTLNKRLATFASAVGLVSILIAPDKAASQTKTLEEWGIPNTDNSVPFSVIGNIPQFAIGGEPAHLKFYHMGDKIVVKLYLLANERVYGIFLCTLPSIETTDLYVSKDGDQNFENVNFGVDFPCDPRAYTQ